jgi:dTMP kinase
VEKLAFFDRVRDTYLALAAANPGRYRVVDAALPLPEVQRHIAAALETLL